ncbi:hypothetical protein ACH41H_27460 [Streptomyces sp. NPDC020800]|uniref:hypothetical protein n=1 Tax=Streptomyces sp. NPDC020800 TaxID=3365092 RepID=UPI0037ACC95B
MSHSALLTTRGRIGLPRVAIAVRHRGSSRSPAPSPLEIIPEKVCSGTFVDTRFNRGLPLPTTSTKG